MPELLRFHRFGINFTTSCFFDVSIAVERALSQFGGNEERKIQLEEKNKTSTIFHQCRR
jgi:hypothetical protein